MSTTPIITTQDVYDELGIDVSDSMIARRVEKKIATAESYIAGAVGSDFPRDDPRVIELALAIVSEIYDASGMNEKQTIKERKFIQDAITQLRMELRTASESESETESESEGEES